MPTTSTIKTHAKINLILKVAPPTADGYHPICSWMHPIDLSDQITIELLENEPSEFTIRWGTDEPVEWPLESDLIHRAHALFERMLNRPLPVRVTVSKSIPAGGGLGGGSSNAAGMFMTLNKLFDLNLTQQKLQTLAHELGTDIPFFIDLESFNSGLPPRPAIVSGIGDRIERTNRLSSDLTLLIPPFGCPTQAVYAEFDSESADSMADPINQQSVFTAATRDHINPSSLTNDLTNPACKSVPQLDQYINDLVGLGICPHLSGSGSTLYVIGGLDDSTIATLKNTLSNLQILNTRLI